MTDQELFDLRREKWHVSGNPVRTLDDARSFIESVGFCLMLPLETPLLVPTFVGAWSGTDENLPRLRQAFSNPRAKDATDLMVRLLRDKSAYEANLFDENNAFLLSAAVFPYFYALVGERNPRQAPKPGPRSPYSQLACDAYRSSTAKARSRSSSCSTTSAKEFQFRPSIVRLRNYGRNCALHVSIITSARAPRGTCCNAGRPMPSPKA